MQNPVRSYVPALFGSLLVAGLIYVGVGLAAGAAMPPAKLAASTGPLLAVVEASGLGVSRWVFSFIALVAVANGALLTMSMTSRLTYGTWPMRACCPACWRACCPCAARPGVAILATTLVAMALTVVGDLSTRAETVVVLLFVFISTNAAVIVLRREPVAHEHARVWTVMPYLGIASCLLLMAQQSAHVWGWAGLFLVMGVGLYGLARLGPTSSMSVSPTVRAP